MSQGLQARVDRLERQVQQSQDRLDQLVQLALQEQVRLAQRDRELQVLRELQDWRERQDLPDPRVPPEPQASRDRRDFLSPALREQLARARQGLQARPEQPGSDPLDRLDTLDPREAREPSVTPAPRVHLSRDQLARLAQSDPLDQRARVLLVPRDIPDLLD